jgi:tRNA modification GTPase
MGARDIADSILGACPPPRHARYGDFISADGEIIDRGIALFFASPHSFTGEDVLELQGHGGVAVMQCLLQRCLELVHDLQRRASSRVAPG